MNRTIFPLTLVLVLIASTIIQAQDRQQRREFIQDLLKGLLESQLDRNNNPGRDVYPNPGFPNQPRPGVRPNQPRPGRPVRVEVSPEMLNVRQRLATWDANAANLVGELRHHEQESPQLRALLADALRFQANVSAMNRRAQLLPTFQPMTNDFVALDRDWRILSTRLKQSRALPRDCRGIIDTIGQLDTELCGLFQVQPQIDRVELSRLATMLSNDYDHLLRGVYFAARGKRGAEELLRQGQALQTMIGQAASLIHRGDYETIVNSYQRCTSEWRTFSRRVLALRDERLRYSVQHIEDTGRKIQEQLWMPVQLDREYLASLIGAINADAETVFNSVSVAQLLASDQPGNIFSVSREFQQSAVTFRRQLAGTTPEDQLEWSYRLFATKWKRVHDAYQGFKLPEVDHRLEDIQFSMQALGEVFGKDFAIGHDEIVHLYSELDGLCKQASKDIHRRITARRYDKAFHDQICSTADQLARTVYDLHRASMRPSYRPSAAELQPMFDSWGKLRPMINKCQPPDRDHLLSFRRQVEPLMVKLQVMYSN